MAQRTVEVIPNLKLFVDEVEKNKAVSSPSYVIVRNAFADTLYEAKLEIFRDLVSDAESFFEKNSKQ